MALFSTAQTPVDIGEMSLPNLANDTLIVTGLHPNAVYELNFGGLNVTSSADAVLPGVSAGVERIRTNSSGILQLVKPKLGNLRLRIARV
jgi:hypothetical protein